MAQKPNIEGEEMWGKYASIIMKSRSEIGKQFLSPHVSPKEPVLDQLEVGFAIGYAMSQLKHKFFNNGERLSKDDIEAVFKPLTDSMKHPGPPQFGTNILKIEIMFKDKFDEVLGRGRGVR